ncbi:MAG: MFS transporter [Deltaproteobacteria bacterium]
MRVVGDPAPGSRRRWAMYVAGSLNFLLSMFYRVSVAVISPVLVRDLDLSSSQLSDLTASFYYAFALSQLPLGLAIDRLGPRITMSFLAVAAVGGALFFAMGTSPAELIAARALLGIGMSGNMMILFTLLAAWFPVNRFAFLGGVAIAVGSLGNLLAATPLALLSLTLGWRESFLIFGGINAAVVGTFIVVMQDSPDGRAATYKKPESLIRGLGRLAKMFSYWSISLSNFIRYGYFAALQSLWLGPFLVFGMKMSELEAGNALLSVAIGYMVGLPFWGSVSDRVLRSRKRVVLPTMIAFCLLTFSIVYWTLATPPWLCFLTLFCIGFTSSPGQIFYAHIKELVPPSMTARALTSVNLFSILGVGAMIHILNLLSGRDASTMTGPESFHFLWYAGVAGLALGCVVYSFVPDSRVLASNDG